MESSSKNGEIIHIKNIDEFDGIKHKDNIIEFEPGGKVGDAEWNLQFFHNSSVILEKSLKEDLKKVVYLKTILHIHLSNSWRIHKNFNITFSNLKISRLIINV